MTPSINKKILIAEKDEMIRNDLKEYLDNLQYDVTAVGSENELKEIMVQGNYSVVFLDSYLSQKDMIDVLVELKQIDSAISVILISGEPDVNMILKAFRFGADDLLIKPFVVDDINEVIAKAINQYDSKRKQRAFWQNIKKVEKLLGDHGIDAEKELYDAIV